VLEVLYHHAKFDGARISPSAGVAKNVQLNRRGVAKYSDFGPIDGCISETVQDRGKLVLIVNRKLYMSYLVS